MKKEVSQPRFLAFFSVSRVVLFSVSINCDKGITYTTYILTILYKKLGNLFGEC